MVELDRIGIDIGEKLPLEDAIEWAARHAVRIVDVQLDNGGNAFTAIDAGRAGRIRDRCEQAGIQLGLHTSSSVNVAERAPLVGEAVAGGMGEQGQSAGGADGRHNGTGL